MDNRHLCVGSTIFYPVAVKGALFSCGDGHAAQVLPPSLPLILSLSLSLSLSSLSLLSLS
eukprot:COSAG03_NODE_27461_length_253_cov_0.662338_1_plen_59_part_01